MKGILLKKITYTSTKPIGEYNYSLSTFSPTQWPPMALLSFLAGLFVSCDFERVWRYSISSEKG